MEFINKYYENGDSLIKVLSIINTDEKPLVVYLEYSYNHDCFTICTTEQDNFNNWYADNEVSGNSMPMPKFKDLY